MRIAKWGNSLAVRIPREAARIAELREGAEVDIQANGRTLTIVKKVRTRKSKYSLDELVKKITPENQHDEVDWGAPAGNEAW